MPAYKKESVDDYFYHHFTAVYLLLGLYHSKVLLHTSTEPRKSVQAPMCEKSWESLKTSFANIFLLYLFHHTLPLCRRIYHENRSAISAFFTRYRRIGTFAYRNRHIEWSVRFSCVCLGSLLQEFYVSRRIENAFHPLLRIQLFHFVAYIIGPYSSPKISI